MRLRLTVLAAAIVGALSLLAPAASAAPPAWMCNRATLGSVVFQWPNYYRCSVRIQFVGPYAYTTYYWVNLGQAA